MDFHKQLLLNRWMYRFFKGDGLKGLKGRLGDDRYEGVAEDGQTLFFHELTGNLFEVDRISAEELRRYDLNIVRHWQEITEKRNRDEETELRMKYFQYLSMLFTEIYLDWYFSRRAELLEGLNDELRLYNDAVKKEEPPFRSYDGEELNKLAFWNATGSGKTLLLHVNILQYLHYFQKGDKGKYPDKIILLTPNEGLSLQHLRELELSGFHFFRLFDKNNNAFRGTIEVIDINKLGNEAGDKTVAVEAFEGNNLVLVDEGHRGTGTAAGAWMGRRDSLCRDGFAFEYSATFGQAVAKGFTVEKAEEDVRKRKAKIVFQGIRYRDLTDGQLGQLSLNNEEVRKARTLATREIYAKCILFDYSYKYFYEDGYGKESLILNLKDDEYNKEDVAELYFTACLLSFYQQQHLWHTNRERLREFNIARPLWVFVGNKVSDDNSDILTIIRRLAVVLNDEAATRVRLEDLLNNEARLLDAKGNNIFAGRFTQLKNAHNTVDALFRDMMKRLFNVDSRQRLKVINLKKSKGEIVLQVGGGKPFGLISIGDDVGFFKECEKAQYSSLFDTENDEMQEGLFNGINSSDDLHLLIGSRKFTEGWSSWRVSTMGLLNMGQGEGSQIIQLFGRGVRLKGRDYSLKRSTYGERQATNVVSLDKLETLNIFGINAGYMAQFKKYLNEEGVETSDERQSVEIKVRTSPCFPDGKLLNIGLKDGYRDNQKLGFKRQIKVELYEIPEKYASKIKSPRIELDMYPRIEALKSGEKTAKTPVGNVRETGRIKPDLMAMFDFDRIFLVVQAYKLQNSMPNLQLDRERLERFCKKEDTSWYTLYIPPSELEIHCMADIWKQEDILVRLLQDYTGCFYRSLKSAYEAEHCVPVKVFIKDWSFEKYVIETTGYGVGSDEIERLKVLKTKLDQGFCDDVDKWSDKLMQAVCFDRHLYFPLLYMDKSVPLVVQPKVFDAESELDFVKALKVFCVKPENQRLINGRSLYLLRNVARSAKGIGFALAGNFYPDFLLWLVDDKTGKQWLNFIDPKGIRMLDLNGPKFQLFQEVKELQTRLADPNLVLNAFIITPTAINSLINADNVSEQQLEERHLFFMGPEKPTSYLDKMFARMV